MYATLLKRVAGLSYCTATFCAQWGSKFPEETHCGILVVGRATNGWITDSQDIDTLFGKSKDAIFNRENQMKWVEDSYGAKNNYNTRRSAFWRVIKQVAERFYPTDWYAHIAWSNLCKVAPSERGNPNESLYYKELGDCQKIFATEINILSPKIVILFTSYDWAKDFLSYINGGLEPNSIEIKKWNNKYNAIVYRINDVYFIVSEHPQRKKEKPHIECISNLILKYP